MATSRATTVKEYLDLPLDAIGEIVASMTPERYIRIVEAARQ